MLPWVVSASSMIKSDVEFGFIVVFSTKNESPEGVFILSSSLSVVSTFCMFWSRWGRYQEGVNGSPLVAEIRSWMSHVFVLQQPHAYLLLATSVGLIRFCVILVREGQDNSNSSLQLTIRATINRKSQRRESRVVHNTHTPLICSLVERIGRAHLLYQTAELICHITRK